VTETERQRERQIQRERERDRERDRERGWERGRNNLRLMSERDNKAAGVDSERQNAYALVERTRRQ
jgi:hypothetical protein